MNSGDTIAAVATALNKSAVGIIRLSGTKALSIASKLFKPKSGRSLEDLPPRSAVYGKLCDLSGRVLDDCIAITSRAPHSYTGEDTAELQCHGSPAVLSLVLRLLFDCGARQARAGEFTKRAFLNGKLDLIQAEAVADLIDAQTDMAAYNAAGQLSGAISGKLDRIYDSFLDISSHFHAIIDYPDEDLEPFELQAVMETLRNAQRELERLIKSFAQGQVIKDGVKCAITGKPNAGKSSLLNALLGFDRAIVAPLPGTTRDTIEERFIFGGLLLRISDTAGIRNTENSIEKQGIERSLNALCGSALALAVFDGSEPLSDEDYMVIEAAGKVPLKIAVINKSDLERRIETDALKQAFDKLCFVSALEKTGFGELERHVSEMFGENQAPQLGEILTNGRQYEAALRAMDDVSSAANALENMQTPDAVLLDVESAMAAIGELNGKSIRDDITERIFERFCVGK